MTRTSTQMAELERLAQIARPIDDDDDGSERQVEAANAFWYALGFDKDEDALGKQFSEWSLQATSDEALDEALRILRGKA